MLATLGLDSMDELLEQAVPKSIRADQALDLPAAASEPEVLDRLRAMADRNEVVTSLIGAGYSGTHTPGVIQRNVLEDPAWYTAYTPYRSEEHTSELQSLMRISYAVFCL